MPGIHFRTVYSVARIRAHFDDGCGRTFGGEGPGATGFWVASLRWQPIPIPGEPSKAIMPPTAMNQIFVTNRHVVDLRLADPSTAFRLARVDIEIRALHNAPELDIPRETFFAEVANLEAALFVSDRADCAIICDPEWAGGALESTVAMFNETMVADQDSFQNGAVEICDPVSFVGFPSAKDGPWWDTAWNLPIAREGAIASLPRVPFTNEKIRTADVMLVSGLSFNGSSGSPVFTHVKHVNDPMAAISDDAGDAPPLRTIDPMLVGIMSGHFRQAAEEPEMFRHGGVSYMTRSTSIRELIDRARQTGFRNPQPSDALHSARKARVNTPY